jgi:hypothetical protein
MSADMKANGDGLGAGGEMLPHPGFGEAQFVGEHDLVQILLKRIRHRPVRRMQRHHEQAKFHNFLP